MKILKKDPPRKFWVGDGRSLEISDCARIHLDPEEQVTFQTAGGKEYDVLAKSWGYYATPSVNGRLKDQGFKTALVKNAQGRYYVLIVDPCQIAAFEDYLRKERASVEEWLDERGGAKQ